MFIEGGINSYNTRFSITQQILLWVHSLIQTLLPHASCCHLQLALLGKGRGSKRMHLKILLWQRKDLCSEYTIPPHLYRPLPCHNYLRSNMAILFKFRVTPKLWPSHSKACEQWTSPLPSISRGFPRHPSDAFLCWHKQEVSAPAKPKPFSPKLHLWKNLPSQDL